MKCQISSCPLQGDRIIKKASEAEIAGLAKQTTNLLGLMIMIYNQRYLFVTNHAATLLNRLQISVKTWSYAIYVLPLIRRHTFRISLRISSTLCLSKCSSL